MNATHSLRIAVLLALCFGSGHGGAAGSQAVDVGALRIYPPSGWVRVDTRDGYMSWFNAAPQPNRPPECRISLVSAGFGPNPQAFKEGWSNAASALRISATLAPPPPKESKLPGGLTLSVAAYAAPPSPGMRDYVAVANVANANFGQAFAAAGTRAVCEAAFDAMVRDMVVTDAAPAVAASRGTDSNAMSSIYANGQRADQQRAAQNENDRRDQDRLARQRDLDRQQQARLAQQRELDRQQQERLAQQREQDRIAQQRYR